MNGLLILDKPGGMTSHDVVARVRRATGESSVGHLGTLDPMATGVLPLLLGKYTRLAQFYGASEKTYTGAIRFGFATDTYDAEGQRVGEAQAVKLDPDAVRELAARFLGETEQMPPAYSAKKIDGKPAYKLARAGKNPELKPVRVTVDAFTIDSIDGDMAAFAMRISAGGYVRAIAHAMGQALGCGAHLARLRRTQAGPFGLEQALALTDVEALGAAGELEERMPHPRTLLPEMPAVTADEATVGRIRNGMQVNLPEYSSALLVKIFEGQRDLIAVGRRVAGTLFQPFVVMA
ncbi:MAG TPA: tRNA pseudouridine(55) synthase TruB [Acidobacteriaceae bacterium]